MLTAERPVLRRGRIRWWLAGLLVVTVSPLAFTAYLVRGERWNAASERTPMELVRYAERRLIGHPKLERVFAPALEAVRRSHERKPPAGLPTLGKGQQTIGLTARGHDALGRPRAALGAATSNARSHDAARGTECARSTLARAVGPGAGYAGDGA